MGAVSRAKRNIDWIEAHCLVPEGKLVGQPIKLMPWQKRCLVKIYDNPAGTRRAILSFGRKNGKTALSACLLLLHLVGPEAEPNSQLYSAAQSREQAAIIFGLAAKMVRMNPDLSAYVGIRDTAKQLYCEQLGTLYRALSADATTAYGLSPAFVVHDELSQVKGPRSELYEALETACTAHDNPLSVIISTQAATDGDLLSILMDDALDGKDPRTVVDLYTADEDDPPFLVSTIKKANPAYGVFQNAEELKAKAADAKRMPSREPEYRNLILNQRVEASSPFVTRSVWQANAADPEPLETVWGGLDLSATTDLTALALVGRNGDFYDVESTFWLPEVGLRDKATKDRVPYDTWADQGYLNTTPGTTVEYEWVAHRLREVFDKYYVAKIAFDRWNWRFLKPWLERAGFDEEEMARFEPFGQGYASMSPALRELETVLLEGKMRHGGHPIMTMCAANAVVDMDPAGNRKLTKAKSSGRIDGLQALAMAVAAATAEELEYATGSLITL